MTAGDPAIATSPAVIDRRYRLCPPETMLLII